MQKLIKNKNKENLILEKNLNNNCKNETTSDTTFNENTNYKNYLEKLEDEIDKKSLKKQQEEDDNIDFYNM